MKSESEKRVLTCVYLRKAEADIQMLRQALVGLIGAEDKTTLEVMEAAIRMTPAPEQDKINSINAIYALLSTMPEPAPETRK